MNLLLKEGIKNFHNAAQKGQQGLKIAKKVNHDGAISKFTGNLGVVYANSGDYQQALTNYERALAIKREFGDKQGIGNYLSNIGLIYTNSGDFQKALSYYEQAFQYKQNLPQAFFYMENLKAHLFTEAMAGRYGAVEQELPADMVEQEQSYITQIRGLRKQMEALYKNKTMDSYYEKEKELKTVKAGQRQFINRLQQQYPEYASVSYPQPIHATEVKLNTNEMLVEFEVTETETQVFLLTNGELKTEPLTSPGIVWRRWYWTIGAFLRIFVQPVSLVFTIPMQVKSYMTCCLVTC